MLLDTIVQVRLPNGEVIDIVDWSDKPLFSTVDLMSGFAQQEIDGFFQYTVGQSVPGVGAGVLPVIRRTATERDTNVATAGGMTTNEEMLVYAIKPEYYMYTTPILNAFTSMSYTANGISTSQPIGMPAPSPEALAVLNARTLIRLSVSQKVKVEAGTGYFNTGFGPFSTNAVFQGNVGAAGNGSFATATAGIPGQQAVRSLVVPTHIGAQAKYRVALVNPTGEAINFGVTEDFTGGEGSDRVLRNDVAMSIRLNLDGLYKRPTA